MSKFNYDECEELDAIREEYLTYSRHELRLEKARILSQEIVDEKRLAVINELLNDSSCDMQEDY
ncbi:MAG: hypothetical protein IJZ59_01055 [Alphaproteobacteria bacterium]|nr:hypothetical protein [Alphaproteobacteria bacterium]